MDLYSLFNTYNSLFGERRTHEFFFCVCRHVLSVYVCLCCVLKYYPDAYFFLVCSNCNRYKRAVEEHPIKSVVMQYIYVFIYLFIFCVLYFVELVEWFPEVTDLYSATKSHEVQQLFTFLFRFYSSSQDILIVHIRKPRKMEKKEKLEIEHFSANRTIFLLSLTSGTLTNTRKTVKLAISKH